MKVFWILRLALSLPSLVVAGGDHSWTGWGASHLNNHWAEGNRDLDSRSVTSLSLHCRIPNPVGQSAVPSIRGNIAYYPTYNGSLIALNYKTCEVKWNLNVTQVVADYAPITSLQLTVALAASRTSPQIDTDNNILFFGTQIHALIVAADLDTGAVLGVQQANPHELALITSSPTLHDNTLFVGVSSAEENAGYFTNGSYPCCTFIGNAAAFRFSPSTNKFTTLWNVTTIPPNLPTPSGPENPLRWSGAGIWGSQPSIDTARNQVFFATGNAYTVPEAFFHCAEADASKHCFPSYIWQESVFALDTRSGRANWVRRLDSLDAWTLVCGTRDLPRNETLCPFTPGPDADFGMAPTLVRGAAGVGGGLVGAGMGPRGRDLLAVGQKSGVLYGLAADTGAVLWSVLTSPGDTLAGLSWGVAADDEKVYYTGINSGRQEWLLQPENVTAVNNSVIGAASARDGALLWQYAETGETVWSYELDGGFQGGIAVEGKYVFVGTGYKETEGGAFYVFKAK
ncbi:quinon protein alcohol dehydrogenase-like superfamily [Chaetomium fimeti]|uniref:Quinon protein alcohol dehydrogenase-like superfamily n=1 Tax=Chaetomium fimeti TaxID=1854472 RepID=A0AAE0HCM5_9PEZI|nr:quinon protein alcohol dehydrogenase-like superfamily [Chaetomium fimeti]